MGKKVEEEPHDEEPQEGEEGEEVEPETGTGKFEFPDGSLYGA